MYSFKGVATGNFSFLVISFKIHKTTFIDIDINGLSITSSVSSLGKSLISQT